MKSSLTKFMRTLLMLAALALGPYVWAGFTNQLIYYQVPPNYTATAVAANGYTSATYSASEKATINYTSTGHLKGYPSDTHWVDTDYGQSYTSNITTSETWPSDSIDHGISSLYNWDNTNLASRGDVWY